MCASGRRVRGKQPAFVLFRSASNHYDSAGVSVCRGHEPGHGFDIWSRPLSRFLEATIIANPSSGRAKRHGLLATLRNRLMEAGMSVRTELTRHAGHARQLARAASERRQGLVVVVGGDGTIREAANGVIGTSTPLLIVPSGTENILAKYLGIRANPDQIIDIVEGGVLFEMDAIQRGDEHFLLVAGIGFDAEVVRLLSSGRNGHITHSCYFWPIWRTFWSYRHPQVHVEADGATVFEGEGMVFVGNVPRYAIGLRLLDSANSADGLLDLCVFPCSARFTLVRHALAALRRSHVTGGRAIYRQARRVSVRSETEVSVEMDGDLSSPLPASFSISPRSVRLLVAADWHQPR